MVRLALLIPLLLLAPGNGMAADSPVGEPAHEWRLEHWLNSEPLRLAELQGKVVLVRWWTAPDCPYCAATAPALNWLHERYQPRGLVVIGVYHHKSPEPFAVADVARHAGRFGFKFAVAVDPDWRTLNKWWLSDSKHKWTSVSFLIDRRGRIRHVHEGGQYPLGSADFQTLEQKIQALLKEP